MAATRDAHSRLIGVAGAALVASSLVGGVASVLAGTNTWANAWTAEATLAAPWPMLVLQTAATIAAVRPQRVAAIVGSSLLGLSAAIAGISGFFDGQLARAHLSRWFVAAQIAYVVVAWLTVLAAGLRLRQLLRNHPRVSS